MRHADDPVRSGFTHVTHYALGNGAPDGVAIGVRAQDKPTHSPARHIVPKYLLIHKRSRVVDSTITSRAAFSSACAWLEVRLVLEV